MVVKVWALVYILVNGDVLLFVLFGGLLAWVVGEVILINCVNCDWMPLFVVLVKKEIIVVVVVVVVYVIIVAIYIWLGYNLFG